MVFFTQESHQRDGSSCNGDPECSIHDHTTGRKPALTTPKRRRTSKGWRGACTGVSKPALWHLAASCRSRRSLNRTPISGLISDPSSCTSSTPSRWGGTSTRCRSRDHEPCLHRDGQLVAGGSGHSPLYRSGLLPGGKHQPSFAAHCVGGAANHAIYDGAAALALTTLDYLSKLASTTHSERKHEQSRANVDWQGFAGTRHAA